MRSSNVFDLKCVNVLRSCFDGFVLKCFKSPCYIVNCERILTMRRLYVMVCVTYFWFFVSSPFVREGIACCCCCCCCCLGARAVALPSYTVALLSYLCVRYFFPLLFGALFVHLVGACATVHQPIYGRAVWMKKQHENRIKDVKKNVCEHCAPCENDELTLDELYYCRCDEHMYVVQARTQNRLSFASIVVNRIGWRFDCGACFNARECNEFAVEHSTNGCVFVYAICERVSARSPKMRSKGNLLYSRFIYIGTSWNK